MAMDRLQMPEIEIAAGNSLNRANARQQAFGGVEFSLRDKSEAVLEDARSRIHVGVVAHSAA
jgi:hypothetical protein